MWEYSKEGNLKVEALGNLFLERIFRMKLQILL